MKKLYIILMSACLLFIMMTQSYSQTVDEIIDNYAKAMGGVDKLMQLKTVKYTGKFSGNGIDIPVTMTLKRDGKARMEMLYQGMAMIRASDGTTGWVVNPLQGNKDAEKMPAEDLKNIRKTSEIEGELINYKEKGYKVDFLGKDDFEGSEVYKLRVTDKDKDMTYYYLDLSTYLILKESTKRKIGEKEIKSETLFGNYQKVDGVMFPMSFEFRDPATDNSQKVTVEKVETNVNVDDDIFKMPVK